MSQSLDFLQHLDNESARFLQALRDADPDGPVPSCPDWSSDDLLWHLAEVQWFWGQIVIQQITETGAANALELDRPDGHKELVDLFETVSADLRTSLASNDPQTPAWTWSEEQTVGFIRRRQAHEALIHRVDAEITVGQHTPLNRALCEDGVDEAFRVMYGGIPSWGSFSPHTDQTIRFQLTDSDASWLVTLGTFTGTDPADDKSYDEPDIGIAATDPGTETSARIEGDAADINCWLWHRPTQGPVQRRGDQAVLDAFDATIAPGIN